MRAVQVLAQQLIDDGLGRGIGLDLSPQPPLADAEYFRFI